MKKLASLFLVAAVAAGPAQAVELSAQQMDAVDIARAYNTCLLLRANDPVYKAEKEAYDLEKAAAKKAYEAERDLYSERMRAFNTEFRRIAERDGYKVRMDKLNEEYSAIDGFNRPSGRLIDAAMDAVRDEVRKIVEAETGVKMPDDPVYTSERITMKEPEAPLFFCDKQAGTMMQQKKISEWDMREILNSVIESEGGAAYQKMTAPSPSP